MSNFLTTVLFSVVFFILGDAIGVDKVIDICNQLVSKIQ